MAPLMYKMDGSPPANAVRILADIIGVDLELKDINLLEKEHKSPEYLKLNPMGTIPTLQDDDFIISESHTIMKYLLTKYGGGNAEALYPSDLRTRALIDQCLFFDTGVYFIKIKVVVLPTLFSDLTGPTDKDRQDIDACYSVLETYLRGRQYVATDRLTVADISLAATTAAMQTIHALDADKFPGVSEWLARLLEEPSFKKFLTPGVKILGDVLNMFWEKNKQNN